MESPFRTYILKRVQNNTEQTLRYVDRQSNVMIFFLIFHLHTYSFFSFLKLGILVDNFVLSENVSKVVCLTVYTQPLYS